jgi:hypothetical protein
VAEARSDLSRQVRRTVQILLLLLVVEYLVLPQLAGARKALSLLSRVNLLYLLAGVALEALAIAAYAGLGRAVLPKQTAPDSFTILRVQLATKAVGNVVPGGPAAGGALGYRLLRQSGVASADSGFALAMQSIGSAVILNVLLWIGLLVSIPIRGFNPIYGTAAVAGLLLIGGFSALVLLLTRGEAHAMRILGWLVRRLPFLEEKVVQRFVHRVAERLRELASDRPLLWRALMWATLNWILDAASLWVFLAAFGHRTSPDGLLISFGLAMVLAAIPLTPGGVGVVEAVLTTALVGFGAPRGAAILGVISYRLVAYWLPIPLGAVSYLSLRLPEAARERRAELRALAEEAVKEAEDPRAWAARHGVRFPNRPPPTPPDPAAAGSGSS